MMTTPASPPRATGPASRVPSVNMAAHAYPSTPTSETAVQKVKRHSKYYINGGDIHFLVENYLFRVHRYFFERESAWFREQFNIPAPAGQSPKGSSDTNPFLLENVGANDFARFLWVFYNPKYSIYDATIEDWSAILKLSYEWRFPEVQRLCCRELEKFEIAPLDKIELYQTFELDKKLLIASYIALCVRPEPLSFIEGRQLGLETALLIATAREHARGMVTESGARSPAPTSLHDEEMNQMIKDVFGLSPGPPSPLLTPVINGTGLSVYNGTVSPSVRPQPLSAAASVDAALHAAGAGSAFTNSYATPRQPFQSLTSAFQSASTTAIKTVFGIDTASPSPTVTTPAVTNGAASTTTAAASTPAASAAANGANGNTSVTGQLASNSSQLKSNNRLTPSEKQETKPNKEVKAQQPQAKTQPSLPPSTQQQQHLSPAPQSQQQRRKQQQQQPTPLVIPQTSQPTPVQSPARTAETVTPTKQKMDQQRLRKQKREMEQKLETSGREGRKEGGQEDPGTREDDSTNMSHDLHSSNAIDQSTSLPVPPQGSNDDSTKTESSAKSASVPTEGANAASGHSAPVRIEHNENNVVAEPASEVKQPSGVQSTTAEPAQGTASDATSAKVLEISQNASSEADAGAVNEEGASDEKGKGRHEDVKGDDDASAPVDERQRADPSSGSRPTDVDAKESERGKDMKDEKGTTSDVSGEAQEQSAGAGQTGSIDSESSDDTTKDGFVIVQSPTQTKKTEGSQKHPEGSQETESSQEITAASRAAEESRTTVVPDTKEENSGQPEAGAETVSPKVEGKKTAGAASPEKITSDYWDFEDGPNPQDSASNPEKVAADDPEPQASTSKAE